MVYRKNENQTKRQISRKLSAESGEAVLVVGTRKAESSNRAQSIAKFEKEATRENFIPM